MPLIRVVILLVFFVAAAYAMYKDLRARTFPVWLGWVFLFLAVIYAIGAGLWVRLIMLAVVVVGYRIRPVGIVGILVISVLVTLGVVQETPAFLILTIGFYALFVAGWVGTCDAEIAFPMIVLTGDDPMLWYILGGWILLPPIVLLVQRGWQGGGRRMLTVLWRVMTHQSAADDPDALRLPWVVNAFLALLLYLLVYPRIF